MDPRFLRSRTKLREAVYALAAEVAIDDLSVSEVCRRAGVTRDTFYRHAASPAALLSDGLADDLAAATAQADSENIADAERALLQHVATHAAVYRNAVIGGFLPELRESLELFLREGLVEHLRLHPSVVPETVDATDESELRVLAAYAASGTVGAIGQWLSEEPLDVDRGVRLILAASAGFWLQNPSI